MNAPNITIRPLTASDAAAYRSLRRDVLACGDGRFFADSFTREAVLSEEQWLEWCTERREHCIIGIFDRRKLVGVMMVTQHRDAVTAEWEAIWLHPLYRKQGIAKRAYQSVANWTRRHGYERVALYIRADNARSLSIHRRHGACYVGTQPGIEWADGSMADAYAFSLDLYRAEQAVRMARASDHQRRFAREVNDGETGNRAGAMLSTHSPI